jgi:hypothetical protein
MKEVARGTVGIIDLCGSGGGINLLYFFFASFWVAILIAILVRFLDMYFKIRTRLTSYIYHAKCHSYHFLNSRFHGKQFLRASNPLHQEHPHASPHAGHLARLP